jgi:two-component system, sensor histidine kinase
MISERFHRRITLAALLPVVVAALAVGGFLLQRHISHLNAADVEATVAVGRQAALLAEMPLTTGSTTGARDAADFLERSANLVGFSFVSKDGSTLVSRGNVGATAIRLLQSKPLSAVVENEAQLTTVIVPVFLRADSGNATQRIVSQTLVGYATVASSTESLRAHIRNALWTGLACLAVALACSYLLVRRAMRSVTRPLNELSIAISQVAAGNFRTRVNFDNRQELAPVSNDFNAMVSSLAKARSHLETEIAKATTELAKRTTYAESASQAKSRFLASASHDLRQPAHALALYIAALRQTLKQRSSEERAALMPALDGMQAASKSLDALLNSLLDVSRLDAGVVNVQTAMIPIDRLVNEAVKVAATPASERGLRVVMRSPKIEIATDAALLRRVLDNLLGNAIRFSRSGRILVTVRPRKDHVLLQVWDQGVGIDESDLKKIFEEFYQVKRGDAAQRGMGLGLAIVSRSAALLGGSVSVRSLLGRGSCFTVRLPGTVYRRMERITPTTDLHTKTHRHVLILDDDPQVRQSMSVLFESHGYIPIACATIDAMLAQMRGSPQDYAAAIIDYRLQDGFTGIEAARRIRARLGDVVPITLITGDTSPERLRELKESGFPVEHKPLDPEKLLKTIKLNAPF